MISGIPIALFGLVDDIISLKPGIRFIIQFVCAGIALYFLNGLQIFDFGFFRLEWPVIFTIIAVIAIVWAINLFNFLDGIDG